MSALVRRGWIVLAGLFILSAPTLRAAHDARETISIPAAAGGQITADLYGAGARGVVLAHGGRYDRTSWREQAETLAAAGFRVVAIDFRAAVQSRAGKQTDCLYDAACLAVDVLAAVRYLRAAGATGVAVVGGSLGGGAAAEASVEAKAGEIDRIVLLAHMPIASPEKMRGRKLFVVARGDIGPGDKPRLAGIQDQYDRAPQPKEMVILEGTAHAQAIFTTSDGDRVMRQIVTFLSAP